MNKQANYKFNDGRVMLYIDWVFWIQDLIECDFFEAQDHFEFSFKNGHYELA